MCFADSVNSLRNLGETVPILSISTFCMSPRWVHLPFGVILLLALTSCDSRPKAPVLRDAPVYQNDAEGFRFLVPRGWIQTASAVLPEQRLEGEVILVQYRMRTSEKTALLELLCFDRENIDLQAYHAEPSHGVAQWRVASPRTVRKINGMPAEHFLYRGVIDKESLCKEVYAFRRGLRVYSFIAFYWDSDQNAREEMRQAMESILWRNLPPA